MSVKPHYRDFISNMQDRVSVTEKLMCPMASLFVL